MFRFSVLAKDTSFSLHSNFSFLFSFSFVNIQSRMDRITEAFQSERYFVLFFEKITTVSTRPYGTRKYSLFSIIPPRWLTELVIHALNMKDKDDTQRRNYVYKTLWTKLRDKRQLLLLPYLEWLWTCRMPAALQTLPLSDFFL